MSVAAIQEWRASDDLHRLVMDLADQLPQVLAEAMSDSFAKMEGVDDKTLARVLTAAWYVAATRTLDHLRNRCPDVPEINSLPEAIERLRRVAGRK